MKFAIENMTIYIIMEMRKMRRKRLKKLMMRDRCGNRSRWLTEMNVIVNTVMHTSFYNNSMLTRDEKAVSFATLRKMEMNMVMKRAWDRPSTIIRKLNF